MREESVWGMRAVLACVVTLAVSLLWTARPVLALPPRPEPGSEPKSVRGGAIELHVDPFEPGRAAVVQWQDGLGVWHDVDGWRGEMEEKRVTWWVAPKDFDTGPFRWVVYRFADGEVLATSESFNLPRGNGHVIRVGVSIQ
jgi:hypothetical protein